MSKEKDDAYKVDINNPDTEGMDFGSRGNRKIYGGINNRKYRKGEDGSYIYLGFTDDD